MKTYITLFNFSPHFLSTKKLRFQKEMIDSIQNDNDLILVTSTSNYIASHIAYFLLINNYRVRVIVSFHTDKEKYFFPFKLKPEKKQNFEIIEIDPKNKQSWIASTKGCKYVCIIPNESEIMRGLSMSYSNSQLRPIAYIVSGELQYVHIC